MEKNQGTRMIGMVIIIFLFFNCLHGKEIALVNKLNRSYMVNNPNKKCPSQSYKKKKEKERKTNKETNPRGGSY